jgi:A/G-specific adenine glycosylase
LRAKQQAKESAVINSLLDWYRANGRHGLPWRKTQDPYRILVSELMLQQTQVARVVPKYEAFIARFPEMERLAQAERKEVLLLWQGLGYNSRAARLHAMARLLAAQGAVIPKTREELLALPGIGQYTAGAVIIFAHDQPALSVDVNVERVLKRVFWQPSAAVQRADVDALALKLIAASGQPRHWQSALMDLGSTVCTARSPACASCPLVKHCMARGVRPGESRAAPKQSKFLGSTRWWRGQILKLLLAGPVKERLLVYRIKELPAAEDEDAFNAALQSLIAEGMVRRERGVLHVA